MTRWASVRTGLAPPMPPFPATNWPLCSRRPISALMVFRSSRSVHRLHKMSTCTEAVRSLRKAAARRWWAHILHKMTTCTVQIHQRLDAAESCWLLHRPLRILTCTVARLHLFGPVASQLGPALPVKREAQMAHHPGLSMTTAGSNGLPSRTRTLEAQFVVQTAPIEAALARMLPQLAPAHFTLSEAAMPGLPAAPTHICVSRAIAFAQRTQPALQASPTFTPVGRA